MVPKIRRNGRGVRAGKFLSRARSARALQYIPRAFRAEARLKKLARALQAHNLNNFDSQITKNYNRITKNYSRITKTKIALISLGAVEEPEIGKRDVSQLEARARDWIEKLRKIKMKG